MSSSGCGLSVRNFVKCLFSPNRLRVGEGSGEPGGSLVKEGPCHSISVWDLPVCLLGECVCTPAHT